MQNLLECVVSEQVVLAPQRIMVFLIDCLKDMGSDHQKRQRMGTLKIAEKTVYQCQEIWEYELVLSKFIG